MIRAGFGTVVGVILILNKGNERNLVWSPRESLNSSLNVASAEVVDSITLELALALFQRIKLPSERMLAG